MKDIEHQIQCGIVKYLRTNGITVFAVPNGGQRNLITAVRLKNEGALSGVADLIILEKGTCLFVEVKTLKGRQQESQKVFEEEVKKHGMKYVIWRDIEDAVDYVKNLKEERVIL